MHSLYLRKMPRSNSTSICRGYYKFYPKYQTAHFEAFDCKKRVNIYGRSDYQLRCMYAKCCGYILMSAPAFCIHVDMSACFARPFVHQSVASARLSVRLMIVYNCARRFIFRRLSVRLMIVYNCARPFIFRPSFSLICRPSVCIYVCLFM